MKLHLLTKNPFKIETARLALAPFGIEPVPISLSIPEIQADSNQEIARSAVLQAVKQTGAPVAREDHGFYLNAFSGWPGPYMAFTESRIQPAELLQLLNNKDRTGYFEMALAYADSKGDLIEYSYKLPVRVAEKIHSGNKDFGWDSVLHLGDEVRTISEYPPQDRYVFFMENFRKLGPDLIRDLD